MPLMHFRFFYWILVRLFWSVAFLPFVVSISAAEFRVGVALRIVTPTPLLSVSGGVGPSHSTTKKEGDLTVRALVFENGENRMAIVGADFLGFPSVLAD